MIVVSNTSPVTNLALVGQLDLLSRMYGAVTIPQAVWYELAIKGAYLPSSKQIINAPWLHVREAAND